MRTSLFLAVSGAILAAASPILQARRLFTETDTVVQWVTVTVTDGQSSSTSATPSPVSIQRRPKSKTRAPPARTTKTSTLPPPPTSTPPPPPPPPPAPAPEPTPTPAPAPAPAPAPEPEPEPVQPPPPPPPATTKEATAAPTDYISTALFHHNVHRANHSAADLTWDDGIANSAEILAKTCKFAHDTSIGGGGYGQNLAMFGSSGDAEALGANKMAAQGISNGWYNGELHLYPANAYGQDNPDMSNFEAWGHFSQLVWKDTKKVGCYTNFCPPGTMLQGMGSWYTVCNYSPAGNVGGGYGANVLPPLGQRTVSA